MKYKKFIYFLLVLALVSPIGIFLPNYLKAGSAWGEWGSDELKGVVGFVPKGMERLEGIWKPLIPDYNFPGWGGKLMESLGYIFSAIVGITVVMALCFILMRFLSSSDGDE